MTTPKTGIRVGDIMTRDYIYVHPETNLQECAKKMIKQKVGSLIVRENKKLKGLVTKREIVWAVFKKSPKELQEIPAKDVMKRKIITIKPSADITEAMETFKTKKVRRLPVVELGKVIGIITLKDILKMDPGLFELIYESIRIREEAEKLKHYKETDNEDNWE
jgi:CBS domain-containing protein